MTEDFDPTAAYHEAGHAFLAHQLGGRVLEVSIELDDDAQQGRTSVRWPRADRAEQRRRSALVALAGPLAELHFRGELDQLDTLSAWRADWREVQQALAAQRAQDPQRLLRRWLAEVRAVLCDPAAWERLCRLADALEAHGTLDADLLEDLLPAARDADPDASEPAEDRDEDPDDD
ncbi:MAG: hypothetical protein MUC36_22735 [Planctomycetes bacterium]|jgi:hypothetical protein|nr:hypothetical protein [Planctomycetota bacterium]